MNTNTPDEFIAALAAKREAMDEGYGWHPLLGSCRWQLDEIALNDAITDEGSEITLEAPLRGSQRLIAGRLGKSRGYLPYVAILDEQNDMAARRHIMFCPEMDH